MKAGKTAKQAAGVPAGPREEVLYVLRLWRDGPKVEDRRNSLKDISSKGARYFAGLEALTRHLEQRGVSSAEPK